MVTSYNTNQDYVTPMQGESERAFVKRAHGALIGIVPNPHQRNQIVWDAWDASNGNPLRDRARSMFTPEQYRHVPGVAYFREHSTTGRDGSPHVYGFDDLANIVDGQNQREDASCYSAIASHHTSDVQKGPKVEPATIGYAGVYRLGMVGETQPQWALFADEFHDKRYSDVFNNRRRRSVEVLRFKDGRPPVLDPIATLGADSPRLNLPVARYEAESELVERYSFVMPASVGANSSYVPKIDKYDTAPNQSEPSEVSGMALSPDDIQQIVSAMRSVPELAWVREQMGSAKPTDGGGDDLAMQDPSMGGAPPAMPPATPPAMPPAAAPAEPPQKMQQYGMGGMQAPMHQSKPNFPTQHYSSEDEMSVTVEQYSALESSHHELAERYSQLQKINERMMQSQHEMRESLVNLEKRAVDGERSQVINDLCEKYKSTGVFDRDELFEKCLYSHGGNMGSDAFEDHVTTLEKMAERFLKQSPVGMPMIPDGITASQADEEERYSAVMAKFSELNSNDRERAAFIEKYKAVDYLTIEKSIYG